MTNISLFGINISHFSKRSILFIAIIGIFLSFILQSISQEYLYTHYKTNYTIFLTTIQFLSYFIFSNTFFISYIKGENSIHSSLIFYTIISILVCISVLSANFSLHYISYTTELLFRSSKLIPVMIGGVIFLKKKYSIVQIISILFIVVGLIGISFSDKISQNKFHSIGIFFVILSTILDSIVSNLEDKALNINLATQQEVISVVYGIVSIIMVFTSIISGQLLLGINQSLKDNYFLINILLFSFFGAIGIQFIYLIMKVYGSLTSTLIISIRKGITIIFSFLIFNNKIFTKLHAVSFFIIFFGLFLHIASQKDINIQHEPEKNGLLKSSSIIFHLENHEEEEEKLTI